MAEFINFYPAYDLEKVLEMDMAKFDLLHQAMAALKAQESLQTCYNLDYSNSKEKGRNKYRNKMYELAFPWQNEETVSSETIARMFGSGGRQTESKD